MDKTRKILVSILAFLTLSVVLAIFDINANLNRQKPAADVFSAGGFGPGIGVVRIVGPISMQGEGGAFGGVSGAENIVAQLDEYEKDANIKGVLVRIDSPGGTVAATQEIFQKIMKLRKANKPVVASMGDLAASGGYYSASACNYIFANQGTITASIGVIIMAPNFKGLFEKLGIKMNVIKSGRYKDILSSSRDLADDEKKLLQELIDSSYLQFLKDVSLGRNIPIEDFKEYADGRVVSGAMALQYKLVDAIGTYEDAIAKTKELAKLDKDAPVYQKSSSPFDAIFSSMSMRFRGTFGASLPVEKTSIIEYRYQP
jgi:protease IV